MRLLIAATGTPTAAGKGYQVRLYQQVVHLAERHQMTLFAFGHRSEVDSRLAQACEKVVSIPLPAPTAVAAAALHAARLPLSVGLYRHRAMASALTAELRDRHHDMALLQLVRMAPYLRETAGLPTMFDLLDAAELNMRERARASPAGARQVFQLEARRLGVYERAAISAAALSVVISQRDFEFLGRPAKARVLPNGVDPATPQQQARGRAPNRIIFSGTMSYFPNADAAVWFAREVLPLVRRAIPDATFRIAGRQPVAAVRALASLPGVSVTGAVPDMLEELTSAALSVCPMRFGSGLQTKILEAMAAGTPVVATSKALEGIPRDLRPFARCADTPDAFALEVAHVLRDAPAAQENAAACLAVIRAGHTWRDSAAKLEACLEEALGRSR